MAVADEGKTAVERGNFKRYTVEYTAKGFSGEKLPLPPKGVIVLTPDALGASNAFRAELVKHGFRVALLPNDPWIWQEPAALEKAMTVIREREGPTACTARLVVARWAKEARPPATSGNAGRHDPTTVECALG